MSLSTQHTHSDAHTHTHKTREIMIFMTFMSPKCNHIYMRWGWKTAI